jgi:hypothetical protein
VKMLIRDGWAASPAAERSARALLQPTWWQLPGCHEEHNGGDRAPRLFEGPTHTAPRHVRRHAGAGNDGRREAPRSKSLRRPHPGRGSWRACPLACCSWAVIACSAVNRITPARCHLIKPEVAPERRPLCKAAEVPYQAGRLQLLHPQHQGVTNLILYVSDTWRSLPPWWGRQLPAVHSSRRSRGIRSNIRVNHKGLREAGYQCLTCHANISHPGTRLEAARVPNDKMAICARCHDGKQLPDDCGTCHVVARRQRPIRGPHAHRPRVPTARMAPSARLPHGLQMLHPRAG